MVHVLFDAGHPLVSQLWTLLQSRFAPANALMVTPENTHGAVAPSYTRMCSLTSRVNVVLMAKPPVGSFFFRTRRMNQFPAFVLVSCLRIMDKSDVDNARSARLFDLSLRARLLQVFPCLAVQLSPREYQIQRGILCTSPVHISTPCWRS